MKVFEEKGIEVQTLNGEKYVRLYDFANAVNKTASHVNNLVLKGNSIRKLRSIRFMNVVCIPISELTEFPFTTVGRKAKVYYYNEDGTQTELEDKE